MRDARLDDQLIEALHTRHPEDETVEDAIDTLIARSPACKAAEIRRRAIRLFRNG